MMVEKAAVGRGRRKKGEEVGKARVADVCRIHKGETKRLRRKEPKIA
jgi:hypothetical protein